MKLITTWQLVTYDVWGNARDGWEVNQAFQSGEYELEASLELHNNGRYGSEFIAATVSDHELRKKLGLRRFIDSGMGDDVTLYIEDSRNSKPLCELRCTSHKFLTFKLS